MNIKEKQFKWEHTPTSQNFEETESLSQSSATLKWVGNYFFNYGNYSFLIMITFLTMISLITCLLFSFYWFVTDEENRIHIFLNYIDKFIQYAWQPARQQEQCFSHFSLKKNNYPSKQSQPPHQANYISPPLGLIIKYVFFLLAVWICKEKKGELER